MASVLGMVVGLAVMAALPTYLVLQVLLLRRFAGGWRMAAALPLAAMLPALAYTAYAFALGSNLFPLVLILASLPAALYLLGLMLVRRFV